MLSMPTPDLNVRASIQEPRNGSSPTILTRMNRPPPTGERMLFHARLPSVIPDILNRESIPKIVCPRMRFKAEKIPNAMYHPSRPNAIIPAPASAAGHADDADAGHPPVHRPPSVMPAGLPLCHSQSLPSTVSIEGYEAGIHPSLPSAPAGPADRSPAPGPPVSVVDNV